MTVVYEVGTKAHKEAQRKLTGNKPDAEKNVDVNQDLESLVVKDKVAGSQATPDAPASNANDELKLSLQKTLNDAGVKFSPKLGVPKLQELVDGLSKPE